MNKKETLALGIFLVAVFLVGFIFFLGVNTDISIQLENGKTITATTPSNFSIGATVLLMLLSIVATSAFYYFFSDISKQMSLSRKQKLTADLLSGDEKKLYFFVLEKGECLQKDLIYELKFSKAKATRILDKLEQKKVIVRISYGKTNKIVAKE